MNNQQLFGKSLVVVASLSLVIGTAWLFPEDASARSIRGGTRVNVNRGGGINRGGNVNRNANFNRNANVNINRNVNVNRSYHGGGYYHHDGIGVGGAVAIGLAGMAVGSMITAASLPPSCSAVIINGISYQQCGSTWYQPQYSGSQVNYIVVNPPR